MRAIPICRYCARCQARRPLWAAALLLALHASLLLGTARARAQARPEGSVGGLSPLLPVLPAESPRTLEGLGPGEQLHAAPSPQPLASFVDSLKGSDAAMQVIVGQGRLLTLKKDLAGPRGTAVVAVGDPTIVEFQILPNPRMLRLIGLRAGVTDLSITTADGETYGMEIHVVYDLDLLRAQLTQLFPSAQLRLAQLREHVVVEGQARSPDQVARIVETIRGYLAAMRVPSGAVSGQATGAGPAPATVRPQPPAADQPEAAPAADDVFGSPAARAATETSGVPGGGGGGGATFSSPQVINLIRIAGLQQVLLKVRIAELDRTALREVGADLLAVDPDNGNIIGTSIGGAAVQALGMAGLTGLVGNADAGLGSSSTAFGIFPSSDFQVILQLLRQNSVLRILAEPNLIALSGHRANFLAGGEFPIPVPQGTGGIANSVTIEFRQFGVRLDFLPVVLDEERIRLSVTPEVSSIDESLGTTLVAGGDPVPGLSTRRANTTVELREGQTLAMAGLLQVELDGRTSRIPGLGDLPVLGPFFSNTRHSRTEKELLVLVTPYLIQPMDEGQVPPLPGDQVEDPTDAELYFGNRIEGRTGRHHRSTTQYGVLGPVHLIDFHRRCIHGPVGFAE